MVPPDGENLIAFETRLSNITRSFSKSALQRDLLHVYGELQLFCAQCKLLVAEHTLGDAP